jgi:ABC-type phosphate transport system substrate-binding protein
MMIRLIQASLKVSLLAVAVPLLGFSLFQVAAPAGDVAVVVNPGVPIANLTFDDLRKIMMGDRQYWNSSLHVTLIVRAPAAHERDVLLNTVYQMKEAQFRQYWLGKQFRDEAASGPTAVYSNEQAAERVAAIPGSISFVDAAQIPKGVKVLRIDGHLPGEPGYRLH